MSRSLIALSLVVAIAVACSQPAGEASDEDVFDGTDSLEQGVGLSCSGAVCSVTGDGTVYTSTYRIGSTLTSRARLVQSFTATNTQRPSLVRVPLRSLRSFSLPESAGIVKLHVGVFDGAAGLTAGGDGTYIAQGELALNAFTNHAFSATALTGAPLDIALTGSTALVQGRTYGLELWTDALPDSASGVLLVGVGALVSSSYPGQALRAGERRPDSTSDWGVSRFRNAGSSQIAFDLVTAPAASGGTIVQDGASRHWSDGTSAKTCAEYLNPPSGYAYSGATGDGAYRVDTDGAGSGAPWVTYCDMTNGGFTLVAQGWLEGYSMTGPTAAVGQFIRPNTEGPAFTQMRLVCNAANGKHVDRTRTFASPQPILDNVCGASTETYASSDNATPRPSDSDSCYSYTEWHGFPIREATRFIIRVGQIHCAQSYEALGVNEILGQWGQAWIR